MGKIKAVWPWGEATRSSCERMMPRRKCFLKEDFFSSLKVLKCSSRGSWRISPDHNRVMSVHPVVSLQDCLFDDFPFFVNGKVVILWIVQCLLDSLIQVLRGDEVLYFLLKENESFVSSSLCSLCSTCIVWMQKQPLPAAAKSPSLFLWWILAVPVPAEWQLQSSCAQLPLLLSGPSEFWNDFPPKKHHF